MRVNPGGNLAPEEVIGRDRFIQKLWRILDRQSLVLTAERRMGKTSVIRKMAEESSDQDIAIFRDLEGTKTALEFTKRVLEDVQKYLGLAKKGTVKLEAFLKDLGGVEIAGIVKLPAKAAPYWKTILRKSLEDLLDQRTERVIFFWDELPLMLYDIKRQESESVAEEILDELRSLRQTYDNLRMVFTGSIGLHHVMTQLKQSGYANNPTNDMQVVDVPPISTEDAIALSEQLMLGEGLDIPNQQQVAKDIAQAADNIPFFIHRIVDHIVSEVDDLSQIDIPKIVEGYLLDPQDAWNLRYYRDRIQSYYPGKDQVLALGLLDQLAIAPAPLSFDQLYNHLLLETDAFDEESARTVLGLLQRDHYVVQSAVNTFQFRFSLIQKSWIVHRGLGA